MLYFGHSVHFENNSDPLAITESDGTLLVAVQDDLSFVLPASGGKKFQHICVHPRFFRSARAWRGFPALGDRDHEPYSVLIDLDHSGEFNVTVNAKKMLFHSVRVAVYQEDQVAGLFDAITKLKSTNDGLPPYEEITFLPHEQDFQTGTSSSVETQTKKPNKTGPEFNDTFSPATQTPSETLRSSLRLRSRQSRRVNSSRAISPIDASESFGLSTQKAQGLDASVTKDSTAEQLLHQGLQPTMPSFTTSETHHKSHESQATTASTGDDLNAKKDTDRNRGQNRFRILSRWRERQEQRGDTTSTGTEKKYGRNKWSPYTKDTGKSVTKKTHGKRKLGESSTTHTKSSAKKSDATESSIFDLPESSEEELEQRPSKRRLMRTSKVSSSKAKLAPKAMPNQQIPKKRARDSRESLQTEVKNRENENVESSDESSEPPNRKRKVASNTESAPSNARSAPKGGKRPSGKIKKTTSRVRRSSGGSKQTTTPALTSSRPRRAAAVKAHQKIHEMTRRQGSKNTESSRDSNQKQQNDALNTPSKDVPMLDVHDDGIHEEEAPLDIQSSHEGQVAASGDESASFPNLEVTEDMQGVEENAFIQHQSDILGSPMHGIEKTAFIRDKSDVGVESTANAYELSSNLSSELSSTYDDMEVDNENEENSLVAYGSRYQSKHFDDALASMQSPITATEQRENYGDSINEAMTSSHNLHSQPSRRDNKFKRPMGAMNSSLKLGRKESASADSIGGKLNKALAGTVNGRAVKQPPKARVYPYERPAERSQKAAQGTKKSDPVEISSGDDEVSENDGVEGRESSLVDEHSVRKPELISFSSNGPRNQGRAQEISTKRLLAQHPGIFVPAASSPNVTGFVHMPKPNGPSEDAVPEASPLSCDAGHRLPQAPSNGSLDQTAPILHARRARNRSQTSVDSNGSPVKRNDPKRNNNFPDVKTVTDKTPEFKPARLFEQAAKPQADEPIEADFDSDWEYLAHRTQQAQGDEPPPPRFQNGRSNRKILPSSPTAPSRMLKDIAVHSEQPGGNFLNLSTSGVVKPMAPQDPFVTSSNAGNAPVSRRESSGSFSSRLVPSNSSKTMMKMKTFFASDDDDSSDEERQLPEVEEPVPKKLRPWDPAGNEALRAMARMEGRDDKSRKDNGKDRPKSHLETKPYPEKTLVGELLSSVAAEVEKEAQRDQKPDQKAMIKAFGKQIAVELAKYLDLKQKPRPKRSSAALEDDDTTLVDLQPRKRVNWRSPKSSQQTTITTSDTYGSMRSLSDPGTTSNGDAEAVWRAAPRPDQINMLSSFIELARVSSTFISLPAFAKITSKRFVRHINDKEEALLDLVRDYEKHGDELVAKLCNGYKYDHKHFIDAARALRHALLRAEAEARNVVLLGVYKNRLKSMTGSVRLVENMHLQLDRKLAEVIRAFEG